MNMKKSIVSKLAVVCLTAVVAIGGVSAPASAKSKGYVFKYKGVSVTMNGAAKKLIKKAGKPSKKTVKKSCAYKGKIVHIPIRIFSSKHIRKPTMVQNMSVRSVFAAIRQ